MRRGCGAILGPKEEAARAGCEAQASTRRMRFRPTIVVPAAGPGRRFDGSPHKLAQPFNGSTVLGCTLRHAIASQLPVVMVTTAEHLPLASRLLATRDILVLDEAEAACGMGASIAAGVTERSGAPGWLVLPADMPLVLPTHRHGLRRVIDSAFSACRVSPNVVAEVDSLYVLMDMVRHDIGATVQPWAALARQPEADTRLRWVELAGAGLSRPNLLCSLSEDEMSPAVLATRALLVKLVHQLVESGGWRGVDLPHLDSR